MNRRLLLALALAAFPVAGCTTSSPPAVESDTTHVPAGNITDLPGHGGLAQDATHKESPRLVPAETYIRTYLTIFGGLSPLASQAQLQAGGAGLFDTWSAYLGALGLPSYANDLPRGTQTNALMIAAFERLGVALCDKSLEKDLKSNTALADRAIFAFDLPPDAATMDLAAFAPRFDVLHRTFLGYPARLALTDRTNRFYKLYQDTVAAHPTDPKASKLTPAEAGFAAMCYGLVRHPEFHLY